MINGIYSVTFSSTQGEIGTGGVVYFINGQAYGGDANFYYKGHVSVSGQTGTGQIHVGPHQKPAKSIFGPLTDFDLQLAGNVGDDSFSLNGTVVGHPEMGIKISGRKVADI